MALTSSTYVGSDMDNPLADCLGFLKRTRFSSVASARLKNYTVKR